MHEEMPHRHQIQPNVLVKPPPGLARAYQFSAMVGRGDPGMDQLPTGKQLQLRLGITDHNKTAVFVNFFDTMKDVPPIFTGV